MLALAGIAAMFCRYRDDPAAANPAILLLSLRGLFPPRERLWWSRTASLVGLLPLKAALSFPHPTQARTDIDRIAWRYSSLCWHCSDWSRASLKIAENVIWDKSRARGVHVPVAITLL